MKKWILFVTCTVYSFTAWCQDTAASAVIRGVVTVSKDERIDLLGKKMAEYNEGLSNKIHMASGYRLMLLSTSDRNQALQLRSQLIQQYPDQTVYMIFQSPNIKLKFGNFLEREDAEKMRKQLSAANVVTGNIYIVPEMVEVKPDKTKTPGDEQ